MAVVSITGAEFTVTVGATAYSDQVTSGTITSTPNIVRTVTLGSVAYNQTDLVSSLSIEFLYDDNTGLYDALQTAIASAASVSITIDGKTGTWTGTAMWIDSAEVSFEAAGVATVSFSAQGELTFA